ncbi:YbjN domain-containing protein [uncultured Enterovirga sp.]|uniref:YbjN domain-containing protein n=1 Tax=uncultured Enterovirga sp. TaxID=2026352 RepID=UPI0035CBCD0F
MMSRVVSALAGLGLAISVTAGAQAQGIRLDRPVIGQPTQGGSPTGGGATSGLVTGITPEQGLRLLQQGGLQKGELVTIDGGGKAFRGELAGFKVVGLFVGCQGSNCSSIAFYAFFQASDSVDGNFLNAFNRDSRFSRVFLDKEGSLVLSMDMHMGGGVSPAFITQTGALFGASLKYLSEFRPS